MISWHYPRTELAEQFLDTFDMGSTSTLTLFAPRRMGKTAFLMNDLIPLSVERDYLPVYVSFWKYEQDPVACLEEGIKQALADTGLKAKLKRVLNRAPEVEAGLDGVGHIRVTHKVESIEKDELLRLQQSFERLMVSKKKILLCLDEVQHLATQVEFEPLVYFLRTLIDSTQNKLKVIFTGSSRDGLQKLFTRRKAPLFNSSSQIDLPELGTPFVRHIARAFHEATGRTLDPDEAAEAFRLLNKVPFSFRVCVDSLMRTSGTDILSQARAFTEEMAGDSEFKLIWEGLTPIDRAVLKRLVVSSRGIYQDESRQLIAEAIGLEDPVPAHVVQTAINRMRGDIIGPSGHGVWDFEDSAFKSWVLEQEKPG